ncbi:hypothetical protein B0H13DRAFT_1657833 [Mycena leptocephala]|nr:hypothetical protein B0H13DRAFT_1657833 [Mycena leptocephala]
MNKFSGTPVNAVWVVTGVAFLLTLIVFAGPTAITTIFSLPIVAQYLAYIIPIFCRFAFENDFTPGPFYTGRFSAPISIFSLFWMVFMMVVFMFPATPIVSSVSMNYTSACLGTWVLLSLVGYYFPVRRLGGVYWFRGPVRNVSLDTEKARERAESASDASLGLGGDEDVEKKEA